MVNHAQPRILVADDDTSTAVLIARALSGEFDVVQASTGEAVLERMAVGDIDLVLLDILMPGIDGFEVCRRLKSNPMTAGVPVIFVTSLEDSADETRGFAVGGVDYITKPIRPSIVRARVRTHVELKRTHDLLEQLASVDPLTGVANRRRFDSALADEWRRSCRASRWLSLALADVDDFKPFNDRHGHLAGDERLRAIAASLADSARRAGDLVARYGGEEFGLILPDVDPAMMEGIVRGLLNGVAGTARGDYLGAAGEVVTVSIGAISVVPARDGSAMATLAAADSLLYQAKATGKDRCIHLDLTTQRTIIVKRG